MSADKSYCWAELSGSKRRHERNDDVALIKCPDCGKDISSEAPACPNCGRPIKSSPPQTSFGGPVPGEGQVSYDFMTRHVGSGLAVQQEINKWVGQGWELHQQTQGKGSLTESRFVMLTFRRRKDYLPAGGGPAPPIPQEGCCAACMTCSVAIVIIVATGTAALARMISHVMH